MIQSYSMVVQSKEFRFLLTWNLTASRPQAENFTMI
jgi:hypothetical protein